MNSNELADIAVIGMAVMGQNLILNMNDHGYKVVAYNRTVSKVDDFLNGAAKNTAVIGANSAEEMVAKLKKPRRIMMMVKAGSAVDETIEHLLPYLEAGDILIDGGNSLFTDTERRLKEVEAKGLLYVGTGVSGGEEGARNGPSIMPGGSSDSWAHIKDIFQDISAKAPDGSPCCDWIGKGGAGHYVKMVHNGIEYGDEQMICEAYQLIKDYVGLSTDDSAKIFADWNKGELESYLIEIAADCLAFKDTDGHPIVDKILDVAGQKGTGKQTLISAAELGQPVSTIGEAVFARFVSSFKNQRIEASKVLHGPEANFSEDKNVFVESIRQALYASKLTSYAQGYMLLRAASEEYNWELNYAGLASIWRAGCIIRSRFLDNIKTAYTNNPELINLLLDPFFINVIQEAQSSWRKVVSAGTIAGIPLPSMGSALFFYDAYRSEQLPANLLQALRDRFGAHTYERIDKPRGEFFHTNWTGRGGNTPSSSYSV